jgi:phosphatidate cytidylyltransferase
MDFNIGYLKMIFIGLIISIMGIYGDFFESLIKRKSGIKDTGTLLPGHGGMVDRVDSLIFIMPIFYLIILAINLNLG